MAHKDLSTEQKIKWIAKLYFGVSDTPNHDVNPFIELAPFLEAKVKDLSWGKDVEAGKKAFSWRFVQLLDMYEITLKESQVLNALENDNATNISVVEIWAQVAEF